ncbi:MAG: class I SAM-dependent methyltransferase [Elusimicrobia bacterium]|nr:class I SAM-dependent methyltransferase [Candidatus Liberimonas magnetica]
MIVPTLARLIVREHMYKPITGKLLCLGRQTISMSYDEVLRIFKEEGYVPSPEILKENKISLDKNTRVGKGSDSISDHTFFGLLGLKEVYSIDVSKYEDADIVHDLNKPVPESLYGQYDFIIDGGTFDHIFDIRTSFENVVKMLKVGGRVFQWNAASNFTAATYMSFGPNLFYDYYILNKFQDCKVYLAEVSYMSQRDLWNFYEFEGTDVYDHFISNRLQMVLVLAEKGPNSTWNRFPVQTHYRDANLWEEYRSSQKLIQQSSRKPLNGKSATFLSMILIRIVKIVQGFIDNRRRVRNWFNSKVQGDKLMKGYRYVGHI